MLIWLSETSVIVLLQLFGLILHKLMIIFSLCLLHFRFGGFFCSIQFCFCLAFLPFLFSSVQFFALFHVIFPFFVSLLFGFSFGLF